MRLLCRYISRSKELALSYFDIIGQASMDSGISVRKRAVKVSQPAQWPVDLQLCGAIENVAVPECLCGLVKDLVWTSSS